MERPDDIRKALRMAQVIQCAGVASVLIYGGIAVVLHLQRFSYPMPHLEPMLRLILLIMGIGMIAVLPVLHRFLLKNAGNEDLPTLLKKLRHTGVVTMAFCETPALYGLVLHLATGNIREAAALGVISLASLIIWFPTERVWTGYLKQAIASQTSDVCEG